MLVWMTSKDFQNIFLKNEKDKDILNAQYVISSLRIRKRKEHDNIISAQSILFPGANVCSALTDEDMRERYLNQLVSAKPFLAALIKGSIEEKYNIVFLCTKNEGKMKYLKYLSEFVYLEFGYPIYEYKKFANGSAVILDYNEKKVLKICNTILKKAKDNQFKKDITTKEGRKRIAKDFKKMSKSELKKNLKSRNLYTKGMSKSDMIDTMRVFM